MTPIEIIQKQIVKHKGNLLFLLDYDGTLTKIVKKPSLAILNKRSKKVLENLSRKDNIVLSIISGRSFKDIMGKVKIKNIYYAGNHGFEIKGPKLSLILKEAIKAKPLIKKISRELEKVTKGISGVLVENKTYTLSVHFRLVKNKDLPKLKKIFVRTVSKYVAENKVKISNGKKVFEVRPNINWDKGKVSLMLLKQIKKIKRNILPIYIGDDITDEDAFRALSKLGITILVGDHGSTTCAKFRLKNVESVISLLQNLK